MTTDVDADRTSQIGEMANQAIAATRRLGKQTAFYGSALAATADAVRRYPGEVLRLIAVMGMGTGALAVIGGTVVIVGFLTLSTGALIAVQGYNTLSNVGIEALTGFLGAFLNVRFIAPATAGVALAATIGAGATAQLGAMRINEEIDALEVMGIRVITYLAATRIVAGVVAVVPIYTVAVLMSFLATRFGTTIIYGQSRGVYDHYFTTFLHPNDLAWSFFEALAMAAAVFRSADDRDAWNPAEALTPAQALACSTDGRGTVRVGVPADLAVVDADPTTAGDGVRATAGDRAADRGSPGDPRAAATALRKMRVALTVVAGRVTHVDL